MGRLNLGRLKSLILAVLVITSFIQVGILWNYQSHGFPNSFLSAFFSRFTSRDTGADITVLRNSIFTPSRIIISEGLDEYHYIVNLKSSIYEDLWKEARGYIFDILDPGRSVKLEMLPVEQWGSLVAKKPFIFEFSTNINIDLLKFFYDINEVSSNAPRGIDKIIISPWEDVNNYNTIYIKNGNKIYKYTIQAKYNGMSYDRYVSLIGSLGMIGMTEIRIFYELDPDNKSPYSIENDIPVITRGSKFKEFNEVKCSISDRFKAGSDPDLPELEKIAEALLGDEAADYDNPEIDAKGALVMKNLDSINKLYNNGLYEYKYLPAPDASRKVNAGDAFRKVLEFINGKNHLLPQADLILTGSAEKTGKGTYEFTFDFRVNDYPLLFNSFKTPDREKRTLHNAITIEADSQRVYNCWWFIGSYETGESTRSVNVNFNDMMDTALSRYAELKDAKNNIEDTYIGYEVRNPAGKNSFYPVWILKVSENGARTRYFIIDMSENAGVN